MAISSKDIEILWKRYSEEGCNRGISVTQYFESNGVPYHVFEKWYKKKFTHPAVVNCVVSGSPEAETDKHESPHEPTKKEKCVSYVNIGLSNGMKIEHHKLSYDELVCFINKIQSLCLA